MPSHASVVEHQAHTSPCHQAKTVPWKILQSSEMGDPTLLQYPAHSHQPVPPKSSTPVQNHTEKKLPTKRDSQLTYSASGVLLQQAVLSCS